MAFVAVLKRLFSFLLFLQALRACSPQCAVLPAALQVVAHRQASCLVGSYFGY